MTAPDAGTSIPRLLVRRVGSAFLFATVAFAILWLRADDPRSLLVPPVGEVSAQFIGLDPVFVVTLENGEVLVLDARSPHNSFPKVVAWCTTNQTFVDVWHGSRFDRYGDWFGGPSPTALPRYTILEQTSDRVIVGDVQPGSDRSFRDGRFTPADEVMAPPCGAGVFDHGADLPPDAVIDELVVHDPSPASEKLYVFPTRERLLGLIDRVPAEFVRPN